jgi:hypothetical protein
MKKSSLLDPEQAWSLLEKLNQLAEELWETHRDAFVKRCQEERPFLGLEDEEKVGWGDLPF